MTYRQMVIRNSPHIQTDSLETKLTLGAMGLAGEVGEVVDLLKKHLFHGKELDRNKLVIELGDVRWYMEYLLLVIGSTIEEIEEKNTEKLLKRYPNGFNFEDANKSREEENPELRRVKIEVFPVDPKEAPKVVEIQGKFYFNEIVEFVEAKKSEPVFSTKVNKKEP